MSKEHCCCGCIHVKAIGIVIYSIFIVSLVILAIAVPEKLSNYTENYGYGNYGYGNHGYGTQYEDRKIGDLKTAVRGMFFFMAALMAFIDGIAIWFWMVIYRAYQHMKGVEEYDRGQTYKAKFNVV